MRLLLDEHLDQRLAERLRTGGHDVVAVTEIPELRGVADELLLDRAQRERRVLLTYDHRIARLIRGRLERQESFHGVLFISGRTFPPARLSLAPLGRALDEYLRAHPADDTLVDSWDWLRP
ncbi:MAG: DUF5615 family PIN-like protein [Candidatus Limnocylindria bacterium]